MPGAAGRIRGIVFDLDGTLYVSLPFAAEIQNAAGRYVAGLKGVSPDAARRLMSDTRSAMVADSGSVPTLSAVCTALGGTVRDLHAFFAEHLRPEEYLERDERVITLLEKLSRSMPLYLYTNNNRILTSRIISLLGLNGLFRQVHTIDDTWRGKPDETMLTIILDNAGLKPSQALFVGDRYDVDLRLPEQRGCPVYLSQSIDQLLRLEDVLGERPAH
jgi:putative hydrolase of the HAD superfamily